MADDYLKTLTEHMLKYFLSSKEERKAIRQQKKDEKEPFMFRWFGIIPMLAYQHMKKRRKG